MPDDQFAEREAKFNSSLGSSFGGFVKAIVEGDEVSKNAAVERYCRLIESGNVEMKTDVSIIGTDEELETRLNVPRFLLTRAEPVIIEKAFMTMDMTVNASQEETLHVGSKVETGASVGWGPFSASFSAEVSVDKDSKRASDYSATTHAEVTMVQGEPPEAVMKIIDSMVKTVDVGLKMNQLLIEKKAKSQYAQLKETGLPPLPKSDKATTPAEAPAT